MPTPGNRVSPIVWIAAAVAVLAVYFMYNSSTSDPKKAPFDTTPPPSDDAPDPLIEKGRIEKDVPDYSDAELAAVGERFAMNTSIVRIRKVGDAELANHPRGFRLFAILVTPDFTYNSYQRWKKQNLDKVPVQAHAILHYFRPVRSGWETLEIDFSGPRKIGVTVSFNDARNGPPPDPAPADMPATEGALLRLVRSSYAEMLGGPNAYGANTILLPTIWLTQAGSTLSGHERPGGEQNQYDFFTATAPRGRWLWWTILPSSGQGIVRDGVFIQKREFIYIDAVTGAATSQCAVSTGSSSLGLGKLVAVPCK